jgi:hypothetical protein
MNNVRIEMTKDSEGVCLVFVNPYGDECELHLSYESVEHLVSAIDAFASDAPNGDLTVIDFDVLDSEDLPDI